jgi:hypothetical protein
MRARDVDWHAFPDSASSRAELKGDGAMPGSGQLGALHIDGQVGALPGCVMLPGSGQICALPGCILLLNSGLVGALPGSVCGGDWPACCISVRALSSHKGSSLPIVLLFKT